MFGAIRGVDLVIEAEVGVYEGDVFVDAASLDVAFAAYPSTSEPGGGAPVNGSAVEVVDVADAPNRHRVT